MPKASSATMAKVKPAIIDCDVHIEPTSTASINAYMPERWRRHREVFGDQSYRGAGYPRTNGYRTDSFPDGGGPAGSNLALLRQQLLDAWNVEAGVLNVLIGAGEELNTGLGHAFACALNDWQIAEWLEPEPRLRGSIVVAYEDPDSSASEIHRLGDDPRFVQVVLSAVAREPLGRRRYWKIYEAAESHGLPVGFHFGGWGGMPVTGAGFPSFYFEYHAGAPTSFQDLVLSFVCEGVFDQFPSLKVVLIEGGFAWLPPLMWRLDRAWKLMKSELPHIKRLPSEYVREHVWITTQPMEEPPRASDVKLLLEQMDMDSRLMFATDYPHWDFDAPDQAFPVQLDSSLKRRIMYDNAKALYRFDAGIARKPSGGN